MLDPTTASAISAMSTFNQANAPREARAESAENELGKDQFMNLLVTQLQHQDPLNPIDNAEFISQLATFSSLEKLTSIESLLKSLLATSVV